MGTGGGGAGRLPLMLQDPRVWVGEGGGRGRRGTPPANITRSAGGRGGRGRRGITNAIGFVVQGIAPRHPFVTRRGTRYHR
jgi:hypothetical protein